MGLWRGSAWAAQGLLSQFWAQDPGPRTQDPGPRAGLVNSPTSSQVEVGSLVGFPWRVPCWQPEHAQPRSVFRAGSSVFAVGKACAGQTLCNIYSIFLIPC